jgi:membrane fusion protein (multidrug efflux system)
LLGKGNTARDSTFTLAFGDDVYPYPGTLSFIDRAVDPQTGTIKARLVFPNDKKLLRSGMNGIVRVANKSGTNATQIPYKAVAEQLGEFFVYKVGDSSKVTQNKIKLGVQIGNNVIVKEGLKPGDRIVVQGVQNLKEGAVITTAPPQQPGAQQGKK